ncbi:MAG: tRNA (adenosine(37)-N6)-dimethylallyltransferase MiaA [Verrucomicrobiales bacterium]
MKRPLFLCGPTASGKSSLALALAQRLNGEIVNGDAFQLYDAIPTLTAAPPKEERAQLPHHLYGILAPDELCDAMRYRELALPVIEEIQSRGRIPIIVGGSGLYLKFLSHGPSPVPSGDPKLRATLDARPLDDLFRELESLDPVEASRTDPSNRRFVTRALEICLLSGQPCSTLRDRWASKQAEIDSQLLGFFIQRQRPDLHHRINRRCEEMLKEGAIEQVATLKAPENGLSKAIGVRQIRRLLAGEIDRPTCSQEIATATRQYAKRQETWFRREAWLQRLDWAPQSPAPVETALALLTKDSNRF